MFLVAHNLAEIEENCNRVIWLEKGEIVQAGDDVPGIIDAYLLASGGEPRVREPLPRSPGLTQPGPPWLRSGQGPDLAGLAVTILLHQGGALGGAVAGIIQAPA